MRMSYGRIYFLCLTLNLLLANDVGYNLDIIDRFFEKLNQSREALRDLMLEDIHSYADPDKGETFRDLTPEDCQRTIRSI
jgi:hypothetical protein